jgi:large subunit ribosomal protein L15
MTKYNELNVKRDKQPTRKGRGIAAGQGKTAGRGTKGQGSRKSGGVRPGFEGGQMPLYMRIPKLRGFKSKRERPANVYVGDLQAIGKTPADNHSLFDAGLVASPYHKVKVIAGGELKKPITVKVQSASAGAIKAIESAGGKFVKTRQLKRPKKTKSKDK